MPNFILPSFAPMFCIPSLRLGPPPPPSIGGGGGGGGGGAPDGAGAAARIAPPPCASCIMATRSRRFVSSRVSRERSSSASASRTDSADFAASTCKA